MRDPHYLRLRPGRSRHPFRAKNGETENRHITAARNDLPGIAAHTAAGARKEPVILYQVPASNCVREFLWRGPLALAPRRLRPPRHLPPPPPSLQPRRRRRLLPSSSRGRTPPAASAP